MADKTIGVIVGSLRKESYNKKVADFLIENSPEGYRLELIEIGQLPLYNQDYDEEGSPYSYGSFRQQVKAAQGIIFVTPEYNRSVPGGLKNALDVGSRPYGSSVWDGKPSLVISSSISSISGFGANHHLRQSLTFLNMPVLQQPEAYLANVQDFFDDNGKLTKEDTAKFLRQVLDAYIGFLEKLVK